MDEFKEYGLVFLRIGIGFASAIMIVGALREILGTSKLVIFGNQVFDIGLTQLNIFISPAGALLTIGLILAFFGFIKNTKEARGD